MKHIDFPNIGFVASKLIDQDLHDLYDKILTLESKLPLDKNFRKNLAGNIFHEYEFWQAQPIIEPKILDMVKYFETVYRQYHLPSGTPYIDSLWINFQQKHEFNPIHEHQGYFSFVIWIQIPFTVNEEKSHNPCKDSPGNKAGCFEFSYIDALGKITPFPIFADKHNEGEILLFSSQLNHAVYPFFSSDEFRISISGNVSIR